MARYTDPWQENRSQKKDSRINLARFAQSASVLRKFQDAVATRLPSSVSVSSSSSSTFSYFSPPVLRRPPVSHLTSPPDQCTPAGAADDDDVRGPTRVTAHYTFARFWHGATRSEGPNDDDDDNDDEGPSRHVGTLLRRSSPQLRPLRRHPLSRCISGAAHNREESRHTKNSPRIRVALFILSRSGKTLPRNA